jgi:hypothetical protein
MFFYFYIPGLLTHSLTISFTYNQWCTIFPLTTIYFIRHNQQEVLQKRKAQRSLTEDFDSVESSEDENWRNLASFGVERNQVSKINTMCVLMGECHVSLYNAFFPNN